MKRQINDWIDGLTDGRMIDKQMIRQINGGMEGWDGWIDGYRDGRMARWMKGCRDGGMEGWIDRRLTCKLNAASNCNK